MSEKIEERELVCTLGREEVEDRSAELAQLLQATESVEAEMAAARLHARTEMALITQRIGELAHQVRTRSCFRLVQCRQEADHPSGLMLLVRQDTGEIVARRPLRPEERQIHLFEPKAAEQRSE